MANEEIKFLSEDVRCGATKKSEVIEGILRQTFL